MDMVFRADVCFFGMLGRNSAAECTRHLVQLWLGFALHWRVRVSRVRVSRVEPQKTWGLCQSSKHLGAPVGMGIQWVGTLLFVGGPPRPRFFFQIFIGSRPSADCCAVNARAVQARRRGGGRCFRRFAFEDVERSNLREGNFVKNWGLQG